jgi:hypothetical protein
MIAAIPMRTGARFDPDCDDDLTLHSTPNVDVMGANIPTQTVRVEVPPGYDFRCRKISSSPRPTPPQYQIWTDGPRFGWWHIEVNAKGMQRAGALAFRNCV